MTEAELKSYTVDIPNDLQKLKGEPPVSSGALLESMAEEFERTARLRRVLWGSDDVRAGVWDSAAVHLRRKSKIVVMLSNDQADRSGGQQAH